MVLPQIGYRFNPVEHEIIAYYLKKMILGHPLKDEEKNVILPMNLYGKKATPWEMFRMDNQELPWQIVVDSMGKVIESAKVLYVFTPLSNVGKKNETSTKQKNRVAGCGSWHANSVAEPVRDDYGLGKEIGSRRTFAFKSPEETVGQWTMYEYTIDAAANGIPHGINCQNYALCKLKRDDSKSSKDGRIVSWKRKFSSSMSENGDAEVAGSVKKRKSSNPTASERFTPSVNASVSECSCSYMKEGSRNAWRNKGWSPAQETHFVEDAEQEAHIFVQDSGQEAIFVQDAAQEAHFVQDSGQETHFVQDSGQETHSVQDSGQETHFVQNAEQESHCVQDSGQENKLVKSVHYSVAIKNCGSGYFLSLVADDPGEVACKQPSSCFQEEEEEGRNSTQFAFSKS